MLLLYRVCLVKAPWQRNADSIQGVIEEGTLVSWFGVSLVMVTRMDVLMCFRAIFSWRYQDCMLVGRSN